MWRSGPVRSAAAGAKAAPKATARAGLVVLAGYLSWLRRAGQAATFGSVREQIRAARAAGDREATAEWIERLDTLKTARAARMRDLPGQVIGVIRVGLVGVFVVAVLLGVVVAGETFAPVQLLGGAVVVGAVVLVVAAGRRERERRERQGELAASVP